MHPTIHQRGLFAAPKPVKIHLEHGINVSGFPSGSSVIAAIGAQMIEGGQEGRRIATAVRFASPSGSHVVVVPRRCDPFVGHWNRVAAELGWDSALGAVGPLAISLAVDSFALNAYYTGKKGGKVPFGFVQPWDAGGYYVAEFAFGYTLSVVPRDGKDRWPAGFNGSLRLPRDPCFYFEDGSIARRPGKLDELIRIEPDDSFFMEMRRRIGYLRQADEGKRWARPGQYDGLVPIGSIS